MSDVRLAQIFLTYFVQSQRRWCTPNHSGQREPNTLLTRVTNGWIGLLPAFYIDQIHVVIVQIGFRFKWPIVAMKNRSNLNFNFASIWFRLPSCTFFKLCGVRLHSCANILTLHIAIVFCVAATGC